jgi:TolB-like protein
VGSAPAGRRQVAQEIERELDAARAVIVLWSAQSLGSEWVRDEAEQAREQNKLIPVRLGELQIPLGFRQTQALDFAGWNGDARAGPFAGLVASVRRFTGGAASSSSDVAAPSTQSTGRFGGSKRRWLIASIAAVAVFAGATALWFVVPRTSNANDGRIEIAAFEPLTKSDELERFAKGVSATLVRVLVTSGTKAIGPTQAQAGGASTTSAEFVLRGRVDREGGDVVASADLVNRDDGLVLWSITQRRPAEQTPILEEQLSVAIAGALRCALPSRDLDKGDRSADLLAHYLRLCDAFGNDIERTPELSRRIVETAPQYAQSYATQAIANAFVTLTPTLRARDDHQRRSRACVKSSMTVLGSRPRWTLGSTHRWPARSSSIPRWAWRYASGSCCRPLRVRTKFNTRRP